MKRFLKEQNGNAVLWALFTILILCILSAVVYSAVTVYANYQAAEAELQRAATMSADISMENANVRDLQLDIPDSAETQLEDNLTEAGWVNEDNVWVRYDGDEALYSLKDMQVEITGTTMRIDATFVMPTPWSVDGVEKISIPMTVLSSVLYIK